MQFVRTTRRKNSLQTNILFLGRKIRKKAVYNCHMLTYRCRQRSSIFSDWHRHCFVRSFEILLFDLVSSRPRITVVEAKRGNMEETVQQRRIPSTTAGETEAPTVGSLVRWRRRFSGDLPIDDSLDALKVWAASRSRAQQAINLYANIDYLRPFFDVEPKEVLHR